MNVIGTSAARPLGFQPSLAVDDPLAAYWLAQTTYRLRREISWQWHEQGRGQDTSPAAQPVGLPAFTDPLSDTLDLMRWDGDRQQFFASDDTARWLSDEIARPPPKSAPKRGSFSWLVHELSLSDVDCFVLALALGGVVDSARGPVIAACLNQPGASDPTLELAQRLWDTPSEVMALLDPGHPLQSLGLFDPAPLQWQDRLAVPPLVARQLLYPGDRGSTMLREVGNADPLGETGDSGEITLAIARLKAQSRNRIQLVPLTGPEGAPHLAVACHIAAALDLPVTEALGADAGSFAHVLMAAWLRGVALYLPYGAVVANSEALARSARLPAVIFVGMTDADALGALPRQVTMPRVRIAALDYAGRLHRWRLELPEIWMGAQGQAVLTECARRFRYEAATIARVAATVRAMGHPPSRKEMFDACRADLDLGELAQPVTPRFGLQELMLPPRQDAQIRQLVAASDALSTVHHDWGTGRAWNECGLSVLFAGPPGTGKTMAAEAIARHIDMPMYRIDLSQVVNKYIGETEKNLRRLFDAADAGDVILFFDEADALFGKRTEVKDAHDRYANLEVSFLLERMERFKGMAILASNRKKDLDEAFMRRLRFVVHFPLSGSPERLRIWQAVLPAEIDCSGLDLKFLADRIPLSGGHIRSAVFNACLQSAARSDGAPKLEMAAVVRAVKDEFDKLGRVISLDQFGPYAVHVRE